MNPNLIAEAYSHWSSGNPLEAGRLVYEQIPNNQRPFWASRILDLCIPLIPPVPEVDTISEIAADRARWKEAHSAFWPLRQLTLKAEASTSTNRLYSGILYLAENVAKVTYNASNEPAPFDEDAGWWVVSTLRYLVDNVDDSTFAIKAWAAVTCAT